MKSSYSILLFAAISLLGASCKKSLQETPFSSLSTDNVFTSQTGLLEATYGIYQGYEGANFLGPWYSFVLSECGQQYAAYGQSGAFYSTDVFEKFGWPATDPALESEWTKFYAVIARANTVIANAPAAVGDTAAIPYIAEARVLRAYAYFMLVREFGDVPLITQEITGLAQSAEIFSARTPTDSVYNQIVADLQYGEANLPTTRSGSNLGRVSAGTAIGLLGKVYLTMAGLPLNLPGYYQKAADELSKLVGPQNEATYGFTLLPNFADVFSASNKNNAEILLSFAQFYSAVSTNSGSIYPFFLLPNGYADKDEQTAFGLTQQLYHLYEPTDARRDETLIANYVNLNTGDSVDYNFDSSSYIDKVTGKVVGQAGCGLAFGKLDRSPRPDGAVPWGHSDDQIHLRFADVLLMQAEADNEVGDGTDALASLNRVRARAGASQLTVTDQAGLRAAIRQERRLELTGEYTTVFDIRRWGTLQAEMAAISDAQIVNHDLQPYNAKYYLDPLPQQELYANTNLVQNSGY